MNSKVLIGIAIGVIIVIGIGAVIGSSSDSNQDAPTAIQEESPEIPSTEGKQYTVELSDVVTATGP